MSGMRDISEIIMKQIKDTQSPSTDYAFSVKEFHILWIIVQFDRVLSVTRLNFTMIYSYTCCLLCSLLMVQSSMLLLTCPLGGKGGWNESADDGTNMLADSFRQS